MELNEKILLHHTLNYMGLHDTFVSPKHCFFSKLIVYIAANEY